MPHSQGFSAWTRHVVTITLQAVSDFGADLRIWAVPITVLVVIGAVGGATIGWRAALLPSILAITAATILLLLNHERVRTWQAVRQDARRHTARLLRRPEANGHRVLYERTLPGGEDGLEHLVVGPSGVYALTSRNFARQVPVRTMHKDLFHGPQSQRRLLDHAAGNAREVAESLSNALRQHVPVTPVLVIHGALVPWKVLTIRGVAVLSGKRLGRYFRGRRRLSTVEVERIAATAEGSLPPQGDQGQPAAARR